MSTILLKQKDYEELSQSIFDLNLKIMEKDKEIERLNNIINEFDKFLFGELQTYGGGGTAQEYYDKLQELKGEEE